MEAHPIPLFPRRQPRARDRVTALLEAVRAALRDQTGGQLPDPDQGGGRAGPLPFVPVLRDYPWRRRR